MKYVELIDFIQQADRVKIDIAPDKYLISKSTTKRPVKCSPIIFDVNHRFYEEDEVALWHGDWVCGVNRGNPCGGEDSDWCLAKEVSHFQNATKVVEEEGFKAKCSLWTSIIEIFKIGVLYINNEVAESG